MEKLVSIDSTTVEDFIIVQQSYLWYGSSNGDTDPQCSGAYIFRPNGSPPTVVSRAVPLKVVRGTLVDEIHQQFDSWIYQVIRLYKDKEHAEVEFTIGPIPTDDSVGKEIITRMTANMVTDKVFYTDSNGRDFLKRVRDYREDWPLQVHQPVAGNYYPNCLCTGDRPKINMVFYMPSPTELLQIFMIAAPVFVTMMSKVAFYSLIVYFATSMGTHTVAAHQVMMQLCGMCTVFGEPLSQTAQSFMPELMYGVNQNLAEARRLLKSLLIIGALSGLILGSIGTFVPLMFPNFFSPDPEVIGEGVLLGLSNTARVLAGVFGTAATGYILQKGASNVWHGLNNL